MDISHTILLGNGINNLTNDKSWAELVNEIIKITKSNVKFSDSIPFPLLYEEIYFKSTIYRQKETKLKAKIGEVVDQIKPNPFHEEILSLNCTNFLTTNYDFVLEKVLDPQLNNQTIKNHGVIKETKFSLFRHSRVADKKIWHLHGAVNIPRSINLGFEHYGGQLQRLRNYVVNGTNYHSNSLSKSPLHRRIESSKVNFDSWVDSIFLSDLHIVGLRLGFEETDLWWLLTDRARFYLKRKRINKNKIYFYCPSLYKDPSKMELMKAMGIQTVYIDKLEEKFYAEVFKRIKKRIGS